MLNVKISFCLFVNLLVCSEDSRKVVKQINGKYAKSIKSYEDFRAVSFTILISQRNFIVVHGGYV
jgi:hypothetical protein